MDFSLKRIFKIHVNGVGLWRCDFKADSDAHAFGSWERRSDRQSGAVALSDQPGKVCDFFEVEGSVSQLGSCW